MRGRIFSWRMILIALLLALLVLDYYFGLLPLAPRFRFKTASAWSSAIRRGETVFGYPLSERGRSTPRYLPDDGTPSFYIKQLRYKYWPDKLCRGDPALKQISRGPDDMFYSGRDVNPSAAPMLIELLNDDNERVRNEAAFAIGIIGDRADTFSAIPRLIAMLRGSRAERLNAAFTLGKLGHQAEAAIPALIETRESDDPKIRKVATEALQRIAPDSFHAD